MVRPRSGRIFSSLSWDLPPVASQMCSGMRAAQMMAVFSLSTRATLRPGYCGRLELIWKQEAVDGLLGPVLSEAADGNLVAFFCEVVDDAVNIGFCSMCFSDLFGENALLDDDFATIEKLGEDVKEDVNVCVGAEGDFASVAVTQEDF